MFTTDISSALVAFVKEMQPNLEMCYDFVEAQGVTLTPAVCEQVEDIYDYTVAWYPLPHTIHTTQHHMRKIEKLMNTAIKNNTDWRMSNTRVDNNDGVSTVYLHNNKIAEIGEDFVRIFDGGWQSNTTKSRLNAIINEFCNAFTDGVYQHQFAWYIRDNKVVHDFVNGYTFAEFA